MDISIIIWCELIKNKNQWSIGNDGQRCTLTNLVEKSTKLRCEIGHVEFVEINIIILLLASWAQHVIKKWLAKTGFLS
jgi:hypothetical protein